jgi:hypothetical protein
MSNRAFLIGSDDPAPAGQNEDGLPTYDYERQVMADSGKWIIPLFWFSIFDHANLTTYSSASLEVPTVVCSKSQGLATLEQRRPIILSSFAAIASFWPSWECLISEAPFQYFEMDVSEIWDIAPDLFESDFPMALRSLSTSTPDDFEKLLQLAGIERGADGRSFSAAGSRFTGSFVRGFRGNREVPWEDDYK